jgi:bacterioferritin-associated ferredoxin
MYVCICNAVTEREVRDCVRGGVCSVDELSMQLGVGAGCGRCRPSAEELLREGAREADAGACALTR